MALIKCPECNKEISDKAAACPNCGAPVVMSEVKKFEAIAIESKNKKKKIIGIITLALTILIVIFLIYISNIEYPDNVSGKVYNNGKEAVEVADEYFDGKKNRSDVSSELNMIVSYTKNNINSISIEDLQKYYRSDLDILSDIERLHNVFLYTESYDDDDLLYRRNMLAKALLLDEKN